jgi:hypothetical protein
MAPEALRIETVSSGEAIDLIDAFRARGFRAGLAERPGTWDVEVTGTVDAIAPILGEHLARHGSLAAAVHVGDDLYIVEAAPEPVEPRILVEV